MNFNAFLSGLSEGAVISICLLLVALLSLVSHLCGPDVSLLIFYAAPVFAASWYAGRRAGYLMCAAGAAFWFVTARLSQGHFDNSFAPYWNAAAHSAFMLFLTYLATAFKASLAHEREMASTDYLTGAVNSRSFAALAEAEIARARRGGRSFSVAYMDVDDFKLLNDGLGHSAGDRLLRVVADTIRQNVRDVDSVARLGGDEFAVLMPETDERAARLAVARLRRRLLDSAGAAGWPVTFSFGVVTWVAPPNSVDEMVRAADELMYAAKRHGKNGVRHGVAAAA